MAQNIVLDFTHTYTQEWIRTQGGLLYLDCSDIEGTDMYCAPEAARELKGRLEPYPVTGVHFLDSGNYHYMSRLFTQKINRPYQLVVFDNHTDMQPTMIPELMSCGDWALHVLKEDDCLGKLFLIGPGQESIDEIPVADLPGDRREKLVCISREECQRMISRQAGQLETESSIYHSLGQLDPRIPVYFSVDKDVLSEGFARTNWDQGRMTLSTLKEILQWICDRNAVLGVDICGELSGEDARQFSKAQQINQRTNEELYHFFKGRFCEWALNSCPNL